MYGKPIGFGSLSSYATVHTHHSAQLKYLPACTHTCLALIYMACAVSGVGDRVHSLILGFFIPTHPAIAILRLLLCFENMHELEKKRGYGDRVRAVESASFTPLTFSTLEDLGRETPIFYSRLADLLPNIHLSCYSHMLFWILFFPAAFCYLGHLGKSNHQAF